VKINLTWYLYPFLFFNVNTIDMLFYKLITILSLVLLIIAIVVGTTYYSSLKKEQKWFYFYLVFAGVIELSTKLLALFWIDNLFVFPIYVCGEFIILTIMFFIGLNIPIKWFYLAALLPILILTESFILNTNFFLFNIEISKTISHLTIIIFSCYSLIKSLRNIDLKQKNKFLPVYAGLFFYYTISIILFLLLNQLADISLEDASVIWGLNNVFSSILYGISTYTFLQLKK
jgi:hypothetical protein